jgi:hypothetical protein
MRKTPKPRSYPFCEVRPAKARALDSLLRLAPSLVEVVAGLAVIGEIESPDGMCTTVPPAKSTARIPALGLKTPFISPSTPRTMWASGK